MKDRQVIFPSSKEKGWNFSDDSQLPIGDGTEIPGRIYIIDPFVYKGM